MVAKNKQRHLIESLLYLSMMKLSPHSLLEGTDLLFGALKECKESTLL